MNAFNMRGTQRYVDMYDIQRRNNNIILLCCQIVLLTEGCF